MALFFVRFLSIQVDILVEDERGSFLLYEQDNYGLPKVCRACDLQLEAHPAPSRQKPHFFPSG